jgi:hypothetical protein
VWMIVWMTRSSEGRRKRAGEFSPCRPR